MSKSKPDRPSAPEPFQNKALAGLAHLKAGLPSAAADEPAEAVQAEAGGGGRDEAAPPLGGKLVVQRERKQRGGKTVTRVRGLELAPEPRAQLARSMAKALGCGGSLDGGDVLLQGDQVTRAAEWLERRGARKVIRGN